MEVCDILYLHLIFHKSCLIGMLMEGEQTHLQCPLGQYVSFTSTRYFYGSCGADVTRALQIN